MAQYNVTINVSFSTLLASAKKKLSVVAQHAKDGGNQPLFSYLTVTSKNEGELNAFFETAVHNIVANLVSASGTCSITSGVSAVIMFTVTNRYQNQSESEHQNITALFAPLVNDYIVMYALGEYLSVIHPMTGEKYPPLWGTQFVQQATSLLQNLIAMVFTKRAPSVSEHTYKDVSAQVITPNTNGSNGTATGDPGGLV